MQNANAGITNLDGKTLFPERRDYSVSDVTITLTLTLNFLRQRNCFPLGWTGSTHDDPQGLLARDAGHSLEGFKYTKM